jgi:hypothetical protein
MPNMIARSLLCSFLAGLFIAGCAPVASPEPTLSPLVVSSPLATPSAVSTAAAGGAAPSEPAPLEMPAPKPGNASLTGTLYTYTGNAPIPGTGFYLIPVTGNDEEQGSLIAPQGNPEAIRGQSDSQGRFAFDNVPPGRYQLVVWAPYQWIVAVESPTVDAPLVIVLEPGQQSALGRVNVPWP